MLINRLSSHLTGALKVPPFHIKIVFDVDIDYQNLIDTLLVTTYLYLKRFGDYVYVVR